MKKVVLLMIMSTVFSLQGFSQTQAPGVRRSLATIMFCGVGGAILGLSTLSFYGQPQEHIGNISAGFAMGLLGGTGYVLSQNVRPPIPEAEARLNQEHRPATPPPFFVLNFDF